MSQNDSVPRTNGEKMEITRIKIIFCIFSMFTYIADISSDIYVAVKLYQNGSDTYFYLTVVFIVLPAIFINTISTCGYSGDKSVPQLKARGAAHWRIRITFSILMAPVWRCAEALYNCWKSRKSQTADLKEFYSRAAILQLCDASSLRLFEAFFESAPQLILQIYIIAQKYCHGSNDISTTEIVQLSSVVLSIISIASTIVSSISCVREALTFVKEIKWISEFLSNIWLSFVNVLCFINPKDDRSLQKCCTVYYSVVFVENSVLISLWYHYCSFGHRLLVLSMVLVSFFLSITLMVLYYVIFHPTRGRLFREPNPEERIDESESRSFIAPITLNRVFMDRTGTCRGMSEEIQTAVIENGKMTQENSSKEEMKECSQLSNSIIGDFTLNRELIDRSGGDREMSEEGQTAMIENGKPREENSTKEEMMECSQL